MRERVGEREIELTGVNYPVMEFGRKIKRGRRRAGGHKKGNS
jgi:hypothetical protein